MTKYAFYANIEPMSEIPRKTPPQEITDLNLVFFQRGLAETRRRLQPALGDRIAIEQEWRNVPYTIKRNLQEVMGITSLFLPFNTTIRSEYTVIPFTNQIALRKMGLKKGSDIIPLFGASLDSNDPAEIAIQKQISPELFKLYSEFFAPDNGGDLDGMDSGDYALILSQMLTRSDIFSAILERNFGPRNSNIKMQFETEQVNDATIHRDMIAHVRRRKGLSAIALRYVYTDDNPPEISAVGMSTSDSRQKELDPSEVAATLRQHFHRRDFMPLKR